MCTPIECPFIGAILLYDTNELYTDDAVDPTRLNTYRRFKTSNQWLNCFNPVNVSNCYYVECILFDSCLNKI